MKTKEKILFGVKLKHGSDVSFYTNSYFPSLRLWAERFQLVLHMQNNFCSIRLLFGIAFLLCHKLIRLTNSFLLCIFLAIKLLGNQG
jgi:hypothetical protein